MIGEVLAGMVKGLFASLLILGAGFLSSSSFAIGPVFAGTLLLNCFLFAGLGVITGMIAKSHEDTSTYNNFFIMPMAFFTGTFFPVDHMPDPLRAIIYIFPLTHTNILIRKTHMDAEALISLMILLFYAAIFFWYGSRLIRRYSE
jgi:ABC-type multidrug transport system permease subunit